MPRLKKLYLKGKLLDVPNPFEDEVDWFVSSNHRLVMDHISKIESEAHDKSDPYDLPELEFYINELRRSANNLALVGLVTRLHHWISIFVQELEELPSHQKVRSKRKARERSLVSNLETLSDRVGNGPVSVKFFSAIVTLRDSIIHADGRIEWEYSGKGRRVAKQYTADNSDEVLFTAEHLQEAIENSVRQVKWYEEALDSLH